MDAGGSGGHFVFVAEVGGESFTWSRVVAGYIIESTNGLPACGSVASVSGGGVREGNPGDLHGVDTEAAVVALAAAGIGSGGAVVEGAVSIVTAEGKAAQGGQAVEADGGVGGGGIPPDPAVRVAVESIVDVGGDVERDSEEWAEVAGGEGNRSLGVG